MLILTKHNQAHKIDFFKASGKKIDIQISYFQIT